jgi:hypothetical protein
MLYKRLTCLPCQGKYVDWCVRTWRDCAHVLMASGGFCRARRQTGVKNAVRYRSDVIWTLFCNDDSLMNISSRVVSEFGRTVPFFSCIAQNLPYNVSRDVKLTLFLWVSINCFGTPSGSVLTLWLCQIDVVFWIMSLKLNIIRLFIILSFNISRTFLRNLISRITRSDD